MGVGSDFVVVNGDLSNDCEGDEDVEDTVDDFNCKYPREVQKLAIRTFWSKLIMHFDIHFQQKKIVWPTRVGSKKPNEILSHRLLSTLPSTLLSLSHNEHYRKYILLDTDLLKLNIQ